MGASGYGESIMTTLLDRFYDPKSGSITINSSAPHLSVAGPNALPGSNS